MNVSCPAVSQISSFTFFPFMSSVCAPNSTPSVTSWSEMNCFSKNLFNNHKGRTAQVLGQVQMKCSVSASDFEIKRISFTRAKQPKDHTSTYINIKVDFPTSVSPTKINLNCTSGLSLLLAMVLSLSLHGGLTLVQVSTQPLQTSSAAGRLVS